MAETILIGITIFILASYIGFELINRVPPTLHTPLMSGSNAISGISVVGAMILAGADAKGWVMIFGFIAVVFGMINVVGGFVVTDRMLEMFKEKNEVKK